MLRPTPRQPPRRAATTRPAAPPGPANRAPHVPELTWPTFRPPIALVAPPPAVSAASANQPPSPRVVRRPAGSAAYSPSTRPLGPSALASSPGGPVAHGPARASRPFVRRCRTILSMTAGSRISAITRIWPPHFGQTIGSTSYTSRRIVLPCCGRQHVLADQRASGRVGAVAVGRQPSGPGLAVVAGFGSIRKERRSCGWHLSSGC